MAGEIIIETEQYIGYSSPYVLNVGDIFKGSISSSPGPDDYVGVHVEEGKTYVVNVTPSSSRWPSSLRLLEEGRGLITWGDQTNVDGTATLKFVADKTGIFHLAINKGNHGVGDYEVSFEEDPDFEPWHLAEIADYLTDGYWLDAGETLARWDFGDQDGAKVLTYDATALGDTGAAAALQAFRAWTDVSGIEFVATTSAPDIYFTQGGFQAYATHEIDDGVLTRAVINMYETGFEDQGGFLVREHEVLVHEIGHALGLGHAGPYNGTGTYELDALHAADTVRTSVMSYFRSTDQAFVDMFDYDVLTPMPADIIAIQKLYGAVDINIGDTIYGQNADISNISLLPTGLLGSYSAAYQDLLGEGEANLERYIYTIKDDGGTDTLDYSRHNFGADIDLTIPELGDVTTAERNIVLAPGTIIENAISGRFSDSIIGNAVANSLSGNAGDDTLEGHGGNDILMGGANDDLLMGGSGADTLNGGSGNDDLSGGDEDDWLFAADSNDLASATNVLNGDAGNDFLQGGDGFDTLFGGADDDDLRGGNNNDFMYGDDGTDYLFGDDGQDALFGGNGEDTLYGGDDLNTVGDDGDDYIFGDDLPVTYFAETAASV
ncbi:M10 family metallopeptidase C-terminal domain-containing protein, partial [Octadecabacter algicola]|uniref:M10 family metallopeptidase C-terminal domain-containing protein n=1 Tax=Octadecabacter algicola TaxID=2909342 RepID=UPI002342D390